MKITILLSLVFALATNSTHGQCTPTLVTDPSGTETWNTAPFTRTLAGITVEANKTLIIENMTLKFDCDRSKILIKAGGKLILKNVLIEPQIDNGFFAAFEGIKVKGGGTTHPQMNYYRTYYDPSDPNFVNFNGYNPAHGILIMQNSTIKRVLRHRDSSSTPWLGGIAIESNNGGILELYNNRFENNYTDLFIKDFLYSPQSVNTPNQFNIINCNFIKEPDTQQIITETSNEDLFYHVRLEKVRSVQIEGCYFEYNFAVRDCDGRNPGLIVYDASFYLQKSGFSRDQAALTGGLDRWGKAKNCPSYNLSFARVNKFQNLTYGITTCDNMQSGSVSLCPTPIDDGVGSNKVGIADCVFLNCKYGIDLSSTNAFNSTLYYVNIARSIYLLHDASLLGEIDEFKFIKLLHCKNVIITENAADISVQYETDGKGNELSANMLSGSIISVDNAKNPIATEVYRNNIDLIYDEDTFNGFGCSGSRDKTYPTTGIFLGIKDDSDPNGPHSIWIGCLNLNNLSDPIIIKPKVFLQTQGNGTSSGDYSKSAEVNFNTCEKPYIFWNRNIHHSGKSFKFNFDDDNPDPDGNLDYLNETTADNYDCDAIGCSKWPIRYIDTEVSVNKYMSKTNRIVYNPESNSIILRNNTMAAAYKIIDLNGRIIETANNYTIDNNTIVLKSNYQNGIYIVQITTTNAEVYSEKIHVCKE